MMLVDRAPNWVPGKRCPFHFQWISVREVLIIIQGGRVLRATLMQAL